jgi:RND family efflux transporter MFP subunit
MRTAFLPLLGAAVALAVAGCQAPGRSATYTIEPVPFEHRVTAEGTLTAATATRIAVPIEVDQPVRLVWLAPEGSAVEAGQVVARFDPAEMEERQREGANDLSTADLKVGKAEAETSTTLRGLETDLEVARSELELAARFSKTDETVFSRHEIIESAIDEQLAGERQRHAADSRTTQEDLGRTKLELLEIDRRKARLKIDTAERGLSALEVRAPHAGLVTLVRNWRGEAPQVGAQMWPGQEIIEIPDLGSMQAEVHVLEADAGALAEGRPAEVVIEAYPGTVYPATIRRIDAVATTHVIGSPVQYFGVTLELAATDPERMKPGSRVRAVLVLEQLEQAIVVPRQAVRQHDGSSWVQIVNGDRLTPRRVEVGIATAGQLVITGGLEAGEQLSLKPPEGSGRGGTDATQDADGAATDPAIRAGVRRGSR